MTTINGIVADQLRSLIERIERLDEEIAALNADKSVVFKEAKASGYCTKTMKLVIRRRKMETADRQEQDELLSLYCAALGMDVPSHAHAHGEAA